MTREKTNIEVAEETWQQLNARKTRPGTSFDDVIQELLTIAESGDDAAAQESDKPESAIDFAAVEDEEVDSKGQDVVEFVRENQPVSKRDIIDAFEDKWSAKGIKGDSWWERDARSQLKEVDAEFSRNVGWRIES